jgi:hypothetical protein
MLALTTVLTEHLAAANDFCVAISPRVVAIPPTPATPIVAIDFVVSAAKRAT